jgi:hypothetical protein
MIELYMNRLPVMRKEDHTYLLVIFLASRFPCRRFRGAIDNRGL